MPIPQKQDAKLIRLRFGGGLNNNSPEHEIEDMECTGSSQNFDIDHKDSLLRRRKPFDLVATAPNGEEIRGYHQLVKATGEITTGIQAGGTVYSWDGASSFTSVGTCNANSRLRGPRTANWTLDGVALIADLEELTVVKAWNGTTFATLTHDLGGDFYARHILVANDRAVYANVKSGTSTPHVLAFSELGVYDDLNITNRPSSSLAVTDPFFLTTPDLRACNGVVDAFGLLTFSTERGRFYKLTGSDAKDYAIAQLYPDSGAIGNEAFIYVGNDVFYGRGGRIESLFATEALGDVATDDISVWITESVQSVDEWKGAYNSRFQRVYFNDPENETLWVINKDFLDERIRKLSQRQPFPDLSPWMRWKTDHSLGFRPSVLFTILDPVTELETTYMGGSGGKIYKLEGTGDQDGGTTDITVTRISKAFDIPNFGEAIDVSGYIAYRRGSAATVTIGLLWGGMEISDESITVDLDAASGGWFWGGSYYWGGSIYWGIPFSGRFHRKVLDIVGTGEQLQIKTQFSGAVDVFIKEIGLEIRSVAPST